MPASKLPSLGLAHLPGPLWLLSLLWLPLFFLLFSALPLLCFPRIKASPSLYSDSFCLHSLPLPPHTSAGFGTREDARSQRAQPPQFTGEAERVRLGGMKPRSNTYGDQDITESQSPLDLVTHQVLKEQQQQ